MMRSRSLFRSLLAVAAATTLFSLPAVRAFADDSGPKRYQLKTNAEAVKTGAKGKVSIKIETKEGSHVSEEAPLKITLKGDGVKLDKEKLVTADIVEGKGASPRFEVPFMAERKGSAKVDATLNFIVCTAELCERESETLSIPVNVQ
jgi:hypothetical protein